VQYICGHTKYSAIKDDIQLCRNTVIQRIYHQNTGWFMCCCVRLSLVWVPRYICWTSAYCCGVAMATSLTGVGILWAFLSLAAALLCCSGFYLPFWIQVCHNYTQETCRYRVYKIQLPTQFTGGIGSIPCVDKMPRGTDFVSIHHSRRVRLPI
jgi:hypothetical protein